MDTKQEILKAVEELPDEANLEDAIERLYLLYKLDKGIKQADAGDLVNSRRGPKAYGNAPLRVLTREQALEVIRSFNEVAPPIEGEKR